MTQFSGSNRWRTMAVGVLAGFAAFNCGEVTARADGPSYGFIGQKQEDKQKSHWNLSDWLETRDRIRLMDLWLAIHSPSPYEFFVGGDYRLGLHASDGSSLNGGRGEFFAGAFASIAGLEARYSLPGDAGEYRFSGLFDLRIFGFHDQSTNLTLQAGMRQVNAWPDSYHNPVAGGRLTVYVSRYFGFGGLWHHYFAADSVSSGITYSGNRFEATGFVDFKFLRVFATYFSEPETGEQAGTTVSSLTRTGAMLGGQLYF